MKNLYLTHCFKKYFLPILCVAQVSCGNDSNFSGGSTGSGRTDDTTGEDESTDATAEDAGASSDAQVVIPQLNNDGSNETLASETDHDELSLNESVVFGDNQVFRVGDGEARNTACLEDLDTFPTKGKRYRFKFDVLKDDTTVQIKIGTVCGIDVTEFNTLAVTNSLGAIQQAVLAPEQSEVILQALLLSKGSYEVEVKSGKILKGKYRGTFDDYLVGKIYINSNKKIIPADGPVVE